MAIVPSQLQELVVDEEKAKGSAARHSCKSACHGCETQLLTIAGICADPKHSSRDCMRLLFQYGADGHVSSLRPSSSLILSKSEATCRYYTMPGGCVRGEKCIVSHPAAEFMSLEMGQSFNPKQVGGTKSEIDDSSTSMTLQIQRVGAEDLGKKIFVGGLSPSVESGDLGEFFEVNYGPVWDAVVVGSQAGDQMQSRGFKFVTFKRAASVSAAVEAHDIDICGKKVEIKGTVPRFELPVLEVSRVDSDTHSDLAVTANKILDLNEAELLEVATPGSLCLPKNELPPCNQTSSLAEPQQTSSSESTPSCLSGFPSAGVCNVSRDHSVSQSVMRGASSNTLLGRKPTWWNTLKEWLPEFLSRVSTRLKDGEWYPLSSLQGDYRAICGLELDHASLGFEKLSDFVRSFPELCRMKIVPVGRGPATHMVLLPPTNRNIPSAAGRRNLSSITTRSLVDGTRSYAEVACHGSAARLGRSDAAPPSNAALCTNGSYLGHQGKHVGAPAPSAGMTSSTDHQPALSYGLHQGLSLRGHGPSIAVAGDDADLKATCDGSPKTSMTYSDGHSRSGLNSGTPMTSNSSSSSRCRSANPHDTLVRTDDTENLSTGETSSADINSGLAKEDVALLLELISRLKMTGKEHAPPANHAATGSWPAPVTMHEAPPGQYLTKNVDKGREGSLYSPLIEKEPKTPTRENNPTTTPFHHPFAGFLSENFPPSSMWGQDPKRIKVGGYGIQGSGTETSNPACQLYEDSPRSNEPNFGTPSGGFSASSCPAQGLTVVQGWLEYVRCALRDKLYGLRFHAFTNTCAPFAKASCVKEIKTMPNASSVTDLWTVGLPFTHLEKMILTIRHPIESHQGGGTPIRRLLSQHFGVVTRECRKQRFDFSRLARMRYFDVIISAHTGAPALALLKKFVGLLLNVE